jgi:hypothetical protein
MKRLFSRSPYGTTYIVDYVTVGSSLIITFAIGVTILIIFMINEIKRKDNMLFVVKYIVSIVLSLISHGDVLYGLK